MEGLSGEMDQGKVLAKEVENTQELNEQIVVHPAIVICLLQMEKLMQGATGLGHLDYSGEWEGECLHHPGGHFGAICCAPGWRHPNQHFSAGGMDRGAAGACCGSAQCSAVPRLLSSHLQPETPAAGRRDNKAPSSAVWKSGRLGQS